MDSSFLTLKISEKFYGATHMGTPNAGGVGQNWRFSSATNNRLYLENGKR